MFWKRIVVGLHERFLVARNGRLNSILTPGTYRMFPLPGVSLEIEKHNVRDLVLKSAWSDYLIEELPQLADRHFVRIETNEVQVAMVYVNSQLFKVLTPAKRLLFWRGPGEITAEVVDLIAEHAMPNDLLYRLETLSWPVSKGVV